MNTSLPFDQDDLSSPARLRLAALELYAERGVEMASVREIAQRAGVAPGLVRHHFGSKAGLTRAVDDDVLRLIATTLDEVPLVGSPQEVSAARDAAFAQLLADFEAMYAMGFSKETIAHDRDWNQARILHIGIGVWRQANGRMAGWRRSRPDWVMLAAHCAQRPVDWVDPMKATPREAAGTAAPPPQPAGHTPANSLQQEIF